MQLPGQVGTILKDSQKISVVLEEQGFLDKTGLKVMQNVAEDVGLIGGFQADYNNQIRVNYNVSKYVSLALLLNQVTEEQLFGILCNLEDILHEIYNVGFLCYENISFEAEDIFLDANSYRAYLVYLPVKNVFPQMGQAEFEGYFKKALSAIIEKKATTDKKLLGLKKAFQLGMPLDEAFHAARNGEIEVELPPDSPESDPVLQPDPKGEVHGGGWLKKLFGEKPTPQAGRDAKPETPPKEERWILTGVDTPRAVSLLIEGEEYVVGKSPQMSQGVLEFNRTISRRHCKFIPKGGKCFVTDMDSANGTFVNGQRLQQGEIREVFPGDRVQLANSTFVIEKQ